MLQRVSFPVAGRELVGTLHLPARDAGRGGAVVLHGYGGHAEQPHVVATCDAIAGTGVAALRFGFRDHQPPTMTIDSAADDARAALRLLRAHPAVRGAGGLVGFSFGGAVAARVAGIDRTIRAVVLAAAPDRFRGDERPIRDLARTKAGVLLLWGSRDTVVPAASADRYAATLGSAGVACDRRTIEGGDHDFNPAAARERMTEALAGWFVDALEKKR